MADCGIDSSDALSALDAEFDVALDPSVSWQAEPVGVTTNQIDDAGITVEFPEGQGVCCVCEATFEESQTRYYLGGLLDLV